MLDVRNKKGSTPLDEAADEKPSSTHKEQHCSAPSCVQGPRKRRTCVAPAASSTSRSLFCHLGEQSKTLTFE
eukprot:753907-Prorocentrum_lima.AAC.1